MNRARLLQLGFELGARARGGRSQDAWFATATDGAPVLLKWSPDATMAGRYAALLLGSTSSERAAERSRSVQAERERVRAERAAIAAAKAAEAARKAEEARLAAEQARKDAEERARRAIRTAPKPVQLGLKDLKAALEARAGGK